LPDGRFHARFNGEQDPHMYFAAVAVRPAVVWRHSAWRLVIPVPAQRCCDRPAWSLQVGVRFHLQDCVVSKCLAHWASMVEAVSAGFG
jgi:hypothetical protein